MYGRKRTEFCLLLERSLTFNSFAHFLEVMFYNRISGVPDPRTTRHVRAVTAFLGRETNVTMATIINLLYNHPQSRPESDSPDFSLHFSPPDISSPRDINCAQPALSTWALQIVGPEPRRQTWELTQNDPTDPTDTTQLRASTNSRAKNIRLATWDAFGRVSIPRIASTYNRRASGLWYVTERCGDRRLPLLIPEPRVRRGILSNLKKYKNGDSKEGRFAVARRSDAKNILAVEDPGDDSDLPVSKTTSPLRYLHCDNLLYGLMSTFGLPFPASRRCHARVHKVVSRGLTVVVVFDGTRVFRTLPQTDCLHHEPGRLL